MGVFQQYRVCGMILECSTGELLARAAFTHHDDQGHDALMHYAVLKELDKHRPPKYVQILYVGTQRKIMSRQN